MALLDDVKTSLRITHSNLDTEITATISACKLDIQRVGVLQAKVVDTDPLIVDLVKLFTKYRFDYQGKGQLYKIAYEELRNSISMCEQYIKETT